MISSKLQGAERPEFKCSLSCLELCALGEAVSPHLSECQFSHLHYGCDYKTYITSIIYIGMIIGPT